MKFFFIAAFFIVFLATGCFNRKVVVSKKTLNEVTSTTDSIKMTFFLKPLLPTTNKLLVDSSASEVPQIFMICENGSCSLVFDGVKVPHPTWLPPYVLRYTKFLTDIYKKSEKPVFIRVDFKRSVLVK